MLLQPDGIGDGFGGYGAEIFVRAVEPALTVLRRAGGGMKVTSRNNAGARSRVPFGGIQRNGCDVPPTGDSHHHEQEH